MADPADANYFPDPRPMSEAPKDRTSVLARILRDLPAKKSGQEASQNLHDLAGLLVVVCHPGDIEGVRDLGWRLAGPFGYGLGPDDWFEGWWPLPGNGEGHGQEDD
ncbi:hypothetical protein GE300_14755 [Rhodobacteraceae bacterium 2CG4]|uniref:Uncharacterized protein n=1 Tax=Halovulum marinum TaxID=2662447 RepID=A0A6L5Z4A6_9RHOB|nr:hypothetical protein [Halovulum marinum]MSU90862.1 hypothetical protein [Halovulum marinum]